MEELTIDEIKLIQIEILTDVHDFCIKNDIRYFLNYGSLIGAIRHNGYIPWDDDIDISMPRPDYERFIKLYSSSRFRVDCLEYNESYPYVFAKVSDISTKFIEESNYVYDLGVNIDISPIDGLSNDLAIACKHYEDIAKYRKILTLKRIKLSRSRSLYKNIILLLAQIALFPLSYIRLTKIMNRKMKKYDFEKSKYAADLSFGDSSRITEKYVYDSYELHDFENLEFMIPKKYDILLRQIFGNYMMLPPVEKRVAHHVYKAYRK